MAAGRWSYGTATYVEAPSFAPTQGGLLDKAEVRTVQSGDPALRGFMYETELIETALGTDSGFVQSATTAMGEGLGHQYEVSYDPFTIYGAYGIDQGAGDTQAEAEARAQRRLQNGEGLAAEIAFWQAGGILPAQGTAVRAGAIKAKLAVGILSEWFAQSNNGVPYFHAGRRVANEIAAQQLIDYEAADAQVKGGGVLINAAGYYGKTTISTVTPSADQAWLFISGKPLIYRGQIGVTSGSGVSNSGAANNRLLAFAQRTYVPSVDGPIGYCLVDLTL